MKISKQIEIPKFPVSLEEKFCFRIWRDAHGDVQPCNPRLYTGPVGPARLYTGPVGPAGLKGSISSLWHLGIGSLCFSKRVGFGGNA